MGPGSEEMKLEKLETEYARHSAAAEMSSHGRGDWYTFDGKVPDGWPVDCIAGRFNDQDGNDFRQVCIGIECKGGKDGNKVTPEDVSRVKKAHDLCKAEVEASRLDGFTLMVCKVRNSEHTGLDDWLWNVVGEATGVRPNIVTGESSHRLTYTAGSVRASDHFSKSYCQCSFGDVPEYKRPGS